MDTVGLCANTFLKMGTEDAQLALMLNIARKKASSREETSGLSHLLLIYKYNANQPFCLPGSLINDINK